MPVRTPLARAAALAVPCCLLAVPGAAAAAPRPAPPARHAPARPGLAARPAAIRTGLLLTAGLRSAASRRAPVVADTGAALRSKAGLAAPAQSATMGAASAAKQAAAWRLLRSLARRRRPAGKCATVACRAGLPAARELTGSQRAQIRDYFCGPATVSEMLAQLGRKVGQLKTAQQLGTTASGTDWSNASGYPVPRVLNANQHRNDYVAVSLPWSPTAKQTRTFEVDLVTDLNHDGGVPLAGNAYEVAGGPHLVGNPPDQTIFHWFDIRGYSASGAITDYEDSVHGASSIGWATGVPAYSSLPSATIAAIVGARGYVW